MVEIATGRALRRVTLAQWLDTPELRAEMPSLGGAEIFYGYFFRGGCKNIWRCGLNAIVVPVVAVSHFKKLQFFSRRDYFTAPPEIGRHW